MRQALIGAAVFGVLFGLVEAAVVAFGGRLWLTTPIGLLAGGSIMLGVACLPFGFRGRDGLEGFSRAALLVAAFEWILHGTTDPPPFTEAHWSTALPIQLAGWIALAGLLTLFRRFPISRWLSAAVLLMPVRGLDRPLAPTGEGGPSVLLVTLDTTRADRIGCYGHQEARTPALDGLAATGTRFDRAFANIAVTGPSHTTLLGGRGTWSHETLLNGVPVPDEERLMSEVLSERGYATGAFVSAYVLDGDKGFARGFQTYDDDFSGWHGSSGLLPLRIWAAIKRRFSPDEVLERRGDRTVDLALDWLDQQDGSWFLWVHLFDPHGPYTPPEGYLVYEGDPRSPEHTSMDAVDLDEVAPYLRSSLSGIRDLDYVLAAYDGEIAFADEQLGRLLEAVEDDTIVAVVGDHGESFGEHGVWFDHGDDVYDHNLRVPLIIRAPGLEAGVREDLVELNDVPVTLLDLIGIEHDGDGHSLVDHGRSVARSLCYDREANLAARAKDPGQRPTLRMAGLRSETSLFVRRESEDFDDALYLVEDGPHATEVDVSADVDTAPLVELVRPLLEGDADRSAVELSDAERARLEALGYMN